MMAVVVVWGKLRGQQAQEGLLLAGWQFAEFLPVEPGRPGRGIPAFEKNLTLY